MNYIEQINAFWRWREINELTHAEADLYMAILSVFNDFRRPDRLRIPAKTLTARADLTDKSQLRKLRKSLIDRGLIEYKEGKGTRYGEYTVMKLTGIVPENVPEKYTDLSETDLENTSNPTDFVPESDPDLYPPIHTEKETETKAETEAERVRASPDKAESETPEAVLELYNSVCKSLPKAEKLTQKRRSAVNARLREHGFDAVKSALERAERSDFLTGKVKEWRAGFDWIFGKSDAILKINEGCYDNRDSPNRYPDSYPNQTPDFTPTENTDEIEAAFEARYTEP